MYNFTLLSSIPLVVVFQFFSLPNFFLPFVLVWQLGQPEKSGWHYVGQTFAAVGKQPAFLAYEQPEKEGTNKEGGGWIGKKRKRRSGRGGRIVRVSKYKAAIFLLGST